MQIPSEQLYAAMIADLEKRFQSAVPLLLRIEDCFRTAEKYIQVLEDQLKIYTFIDTNEEIKFYKDLLPPFLSESGFYCLLNYAHNFCPAAKQDQLEFWKRQAGRLEKFQHKNPEFYSYYVNGQTQLDRQYYTSPLPGSYPKLAGEYMARARFKEYAEEQIKIIG